MCCGDIYPYVHEIEEKGDIRWHKPLQQASNRFEFLGHDLETIHKLIGLDTYLDKYNVINESADSKMTDHESFDDWHLKLTMDGKKLLCCPEDIEIIVTVISFIASWCN